MDVLLLEDRSTVVEFYSPKRPSSATCRFLSPAGSALLTPAVTVDSLSRTVTAVSSDLEVQFTASTGSGSPVAGRRYWWRTIDDGAQEALVMLSEYDANIWTLESGVPSDTARVGDTLYGARLTATITSTCLTIFLGRLYWSDLLLAGTSPTNQIPFPPALIRSAEEPPHLRKWLLLRQKPRSAV